MECLQCNLITNNNIPQDHAAISETVDKEIDAAIDCNEKVTDQKYLRTNRNSLLKIYYFQSKIFQLIDQSRLTYPGIFPDDLKYCWNVLNRMTDDEYQDN